MQFLTAFFLLVAIVLQCQLAFGNHKKAERQGIKPTLGSPDRTPIKTLPLTSRQQATRSKRSAGHIITECILITSESGRYFYKATEDSDKVCGIYFFTDPDKIIEMRFEYFDVPCQDGGLVSFVDGWELNGQYFPNIWDHQKPFEERYQETCGVKKIKKVLTTSQNAGLLQYRVPKKSNGFSFTVRFVRTPNPCNILTEGTTDIYTLRNFGKAINCSLTAVFPAKVDILAMNVGVVNPLIPMEVETGTIHKCGKRGMRDLVQVGGSQGLDTSRLVTVDDICGLDSKPQPNDVIVFCEVTTVRLVSSGEYDNSVTVMVKQAGEDDIVLSSVVCGL